MKRTKGLFVILGLAVAPFFFFGSAQAGTIIDNFSDAAYSATLWTANSTGGGTAVVEGGELKLTVPAGGDVWASFDNKFAVPGDFTMTFNVRYPAPFPDSRLRGGISFGWSDGHWINQHFWGSDYATKEYQVGSDAGGVYSAGASSSGGLFTVQRVGNQLTFKFDDATYNFDNSTSQTWYSEDAHFSLVLWWGQGDREGFADTSIYFDNFSITGPQVVPLPGALVLFAPGLLGLFGIRRWVGKK